MRKKVTEEDTELRPFRLLPGQTGEGAERIQFMGDPGPALYKRGMDGALRRVSEFIKPRKVKSVISERGAKK